MTSTGEKDERAGKVKNALHLAHVSSIITYLRRYGIYRVSHWSNSPGALAAVRGLERVPVPSQSAVSINQHRLSSNDCHRDEDKDNTVSCIAPATVISYICTWRIVVRIPVKREQGWRDG